MILFASELNVLNNVFSNDQRGNLNTRLSKLDAGDKYDALILAAAGMDRMGWAERIEQVRFIPDLV